MFRLSLTKHVYDTPVTHQKSINGIDLIKFICAILVFIIHVEPFQGELSGVRLAMTFGLQHFICRLAVPFYFVCSGFFLFSKQSFHGPDIDLVKKYCFKILRLIGIWYILLFIGWTEHLWYLRATVVAVVLLTLCFRSHIKYGHICVIAFLLYITGLLGDSYYGLIAPLKNITFFNRVIRCYEFVFDTTRNGLFMGFIFVLIGASLSHCEIKIKPLTAAVGFSISMACLFAEICVLKYFDLPKSYNMYIFMLPAVYYLFTFAYTVQLKDRPLYKHLRNIGMLVYFTHIATNQIASRTISTLDQHWDLGLTQYSFVISLTFTLLVSTGIEYLSTKNKFKWLNWLIS